MGSRGHNRIRGHGLDLKVRRTYGVRVPAQGKITRWLDDPWRSLKGSREVKAPDTQPNSRGIGSAQPNRVICAQKWGIIVASKNDKKSGKKSDSKKSSKDAEKAAAKHQRKVAEKKARESRAAAKDAEKVAAKKAKAAAERDKELAKKAAKRDGKKHDKKNRDGKKHAPAPKPHKVPAPKGKAPMKAPISRETAAPPAVDANPPAVTAAPLPRTPAETTTPTPILVPNESWTVTALRARARALAIPGYSRMTKAELLDKLVAH